MNLFPTERATFVRVAERCQLTNVVLVTAEERYTGIVLTTHHNATSVRVQERLGSYGNDE